MSDYENPFYDAEDLIENLSRGCEVEFLYGGKKYSITHTSEGEVAVTEFYNEESGRLYPNSRKALNYKLGDKKIKDVIADMKILVR